MQLYDRGYQRLPTYSQQLLYTRLSPIFLMSSQQSNERKRNRPLSRITLRACQLLRVNAQRAANWFRKPSIPRFKLKSGFISTSSPRSRSSPYSHSSSTDDASLSNQSSSTTLHSNRSIRPRPPQTTSTYNTRRQVRTSPVIIPIMPTFWI